MRGPPVGHDVAGEVPVALEDVIEQMAVFAVVLAIREVVRAHHGLDVRVLDADFKGQKIRFAGAALIDDDVGGGAARFLVVESEVLDASHDVLRLNGANVGGGDFSGEDGVFALGFESASVTRIAAGEIDVAAEVDVDAIVGDLDADDAAVLRGEVKVPACGAGDGGRECSCGAASDGRASTAIGEVEGGDVETGNGGDPSGSASRDIPRVGGSDAALNHLELFALGHLREEGVGFSVGSGGGGGGCRRGSGSGGGVGSPTGG